MFSIHRVITIEGNLCLNKNRWTRLFPSILSAESIDTTSVIIDSCRWLHSLQLRADADLCRLKVGLMQCCFKVWPTVSVWGRLSEQMQNPRSTVQTRPIESCLRKPTSFQLLNWAQQTTLIYTYRNNSQWHYASSEWLWIQREKLMSTSNSQGENILVKSSRCFQSVIKLALQ